jgi:hypothetical protein
MGGYHEMKRIKYIKCGGRIKGRINVGLVLIGIRSVLGIAYSPPANLACYKEKLTITLDNVCIVKSSLSHIMEQPVPFS